MTKRIWAFAAAIATVACTPGMPWMTVNSPHDRSGIMTAKSADVMTPDAGGSDASASDVAASGSDASASDASASDVPAAPAVPVTLDLRVDGRAVTVKPVLQSRFDLVGVMPDWVYRATYDLGDPDDPEGYKVTVTLVSTKPFDHPELSPEDLMQAAYQIRRTAPGTMVNRHSVFARASIPKDAFRIDGATMSIALEQPLLLSGMDLSTKVAVTGLPRP